MDKQTVIYQYNEILFNSKRNKFLIEPTMWRNLKSVTLNERSHLQKAPNAWFYSYQTLEKAKLGLKGETAIASGHWEEGNPLQTDITRKRQAIEMFYVKTVLVVMLIATFVKTHQTVHLKNWWVLLYANYSENDKNVYLSFSINWSPHILTFPL